MEGFCRFGLTQFWSSRLETSPPSRFFSAWIGRASYIHGITTTSEVEEPGTTPAAPAETPTAWLEGMHRSRRSGNADPALAGTVGGNRYPGPFDGWQAGHLPSPRNWSRRRV